MFGKAYNSIGGKLNVLSAMMKGQKTKLTKMIFYKKVIISSGDEFRDDWMSYMSTSQKYTEFFKPVSLLAICSKVIERIIYKCSY